MKEGRCTKEGKYEGRGRGRKRKGGRGREGERKENMIERKQCTKEGRKEGRQEGIGWKDDTFFFKASRVTLASIKRLFVGSFVCASARRSSFMP